ncbi:MAG: 50S ribosomal protein L33 [Candidatus Omnitrophica bacterium]|nr:50S ribosomal protein L33 [Candidatus Omnitrophota bacterium]
MRELIALKCTKCNSKNYYLTKNKRKHPEKMGLNKFCRICRRYVMHKETKV